MADRQSRSGLWRTHGFGQNGLAGRLLSNGKWRAHVGPSRTLHLALPWICTSSANGLAAPPASLICWGILCSYFVLPLALPYGGNRCFPFPRWKGLGFGWFGLLGCDGCDVPGLDGWWLPFTGRGNKVNDGFHIMIFIPHRNFCRFNLQLLGLRLAWEIGQFVHPAEAFFQRRITRSEWDSINTPANLPLCSSSLNSFSATGTFFVTSSPDGYCRQDVANPC